MVAKRSLSLAKRIHFLGQSHNGLLKFTHGISQIGDVLGCDVILRSISGAVGSPIATLHKLDNLVPNAHSSSLASGEQQSDSE